MNWYKKAQNQNMIMLISGWLRSARDQDLYVQDLMYNIEALGGEIHTPDEISNSAQSASMIVSQEQGGYLTLHQQNLLSQIASNIQPQGNNLYSEQPSSIQPLPQI